MPRCPRSSRARRSALAAAWLLGACTTRTITPTVALDPAAPPPAAAAPDSGITMVAETNAARAVVAAFVAAEARGDAAADTLLMPGADFIMGGIVITSRPRLAAFVGRGEATLEEAREGLAGAFAYVVVVYRFDGATPALRERARGTFVLERRTAGWRIRHVHTSMVERW